MSLENTSSTKQCSAMDILKLIKLPALIVLLAFGPLAVRSISAQPGVSVPVESFYNELAPYGQWMQHPGYGSVWLPSVGPDFQPYSTNGHWIMTEYGNTWVSDYAWGWGPFHYGRWMYDPAYGGWLWLPDTDWAPAWVSWRSGGGYYGWAPLGPGMNITVNINIPAPYWTFVPQVYFTSPSWYSYAVPRPRVVNIYQNTTIINNYYRSNNRSYGFGPPRGDIERITRQSVPVYRIDRMDRPGRSVVGNGSVGFYHPGQSRNYGQAYGRNDRFDNAPRSGYTSPEPVNRGGNDPYRGYNGGTDTPNRPYNGGTGGAPDRGGYNNNFSIDRNGNAGNTPGPGSGTYNRPQPDRIESGRGSYSPGNAQPQPGYSQPSPRPEQQGPVNSQPTPGGRNGGGFGQMPENRGMQNQSRGQDQPQRPNNESNPGGRGQRGPR